MQTAGLLKALGPASWGTLNVAQAAGLLCTTIVTAGLGSFGASVVALTPSGGQPALYLSSVGARTRLFGIVAIVIGPLAWLLAPRDGAAAAVVACGALLAGLGGAWYFVGRGQPGRWLMIEVLPLAVGTLVGVAAALGTGAALAFALPFFAGAAVAAIRVLRAVRCDLDVEQSPVGELAVRTYLRENSTLLAAGLAGGVNSYGSSLLLAATGSPQVPSFLLLDRMVKYVIAGAAPILQVVQRWVPAGSPEGLRSRGLRALGGAVVGGLTAALCFGLLAAPAATLLSAGTVTVDSSQVLVFSLLVGVLLVTQVNALAVLVPFGGRNELARSTAAGAILLVVGGLVAGRLFGPIGVVWTVLAVEAGILGVQITTVLRTRHPGAP